MPFKICIIVIFMVNFNSFKFKRLRGFGTMNNTWLAFFIAILFNWTMFFSVVAATNEIVSNERECLAPSLQLNRTYFAGVFALLRDDQQNLVRPSHRKLIRGN